MPDEDDVLESRRPVSRWVRRTALITGSVLVAALLVVRFWPDGQDAKSPGAAAASAAPATRSVPAWPTVMSACAEETELPIVSSSRAARHTGLTLLVGGRALHLVDFDSGEYDDAVVASHHGSEFITALAPGYAALGTCAGPDTAATGIVRISADAPRRVEMPMPMNTLYADGSHAWGVGFPSDDDHAGAIVRLGGGRPVPLPRGLWPNGITGGLLVGSGPGTGNGGAPLLLIDVTTARVRAGLGPGTALAVGDGLVVWSENCRVSSARPCQLHRRPVAGGATTSYRIPRPPGASLGALSPDGRRLAFTIERREPDPRYQHSHPGSPTDIAVLHFDTGLLELVPGVELPTKTSPALAFSADGQWLAIALDTGRSIRLLAWRTGLALPIESSSVAGPVWGAPALQVLPAR